MFRVDFITNHADGSVETGKVIVVAESIEAAQQIVTSELHLPPSRTRVDATKIKPSIYPVETHHTQPRGVGPRRSYDDVPLVRHRQFHVLIDAVANARSETQAMYKVAEDLHLRAANRPTRHKVSMAVTCQAGGPNASPRTGMSEIETYRPATKPIQGGRMR